ncbi:MAG: hypothetical protein KIT08_07225 [Anaerolineales bacterium]|nr:MAG: hypothetical protein KIT08_07225 [Anaerolineales bacterium]
MAYYLVTAEPKAELMRELRTRLDSSEIQAMQPFGQSLHHGLENAKLQADGTAIWEEEDYCIPPLAQERAAVLDDYFSGIKVERVQEGAGWQRIEDLPRLFASLLD